MNLDGNESGDYGEEIPLLHLDTPLNPADAPKFYEAFKEFDQQDTGFVLIRDLHLVLRRCGLNPSEESVQEFSNLVWDGTGRLSWPVFADRLAELLADSSDTELCYRETFRVFSKNDRGCIPMEEIKFVLSQVCPEEEAEKIVCELDKNGDGFISYTEFRCLLGAKTVYNKSN